MRLLRRAAAIALLACMLAGIPALAQQPIIYNPQDPATLDIAYIQGGALVTSHAMPNPRGVIARYTGAELESTVQEVKCRARFEGGGSITLVLGPIEPWALSGIIDRSIHVVFSSEGCYLGFYENGALKDVIAEAYELDTTGETEYTFGISISGETATVLLPTGKKVKKRDSRVKSCNGPRVVFEHYLTAEEVAKGASPRLTYVYAKPAKGAALEDSFDRPDGLPFMAPTGQPYVQFRNDT